MSRSHSRRMRNYEHRDFSYLLAEKENTKTVSEKETAAKCEKQEFSLYRQRIFSNERARYIYSADAKVFHEKHCECVKLIPDEELRYSEIYLAEMKQCAFCEIDAYLRLGAKDFENAELYKRFFEQCRVTRGQLRNLYVKQGMKTRISVKSLFVWYKEDTWMIRLLSPKGNVQLLHNNYRRLGEGQRCFTKGFHIQNRICEDTNLVYALGVIRNYDYNPENALQHKRKAEFQVSEESIVLENHEEPGTSVLGRWERIKEWLRWVKRKFRRKG